MPERKTRHTGYFRAIEKRLGEAGDEVMKAWRAQAKRHDRVGEMSYRGLELLHGGAKLAARSMSRLEEVTEPPHRTGRPEPHLPAHEPAHPARHAPASTPAARHRPAPPHKTEVTAS